MANPVSALNTVVNDVSDTSIAIAWTPVADAQTYEIARTIPNDGSFSPVVSVSGPSFAQSGLSPATAYRYRVTITGGDRGAPSLPTVTATTLPVPPRCDTPGSCPIR